MSHRTVSGFIHSVYYLSPFVNHHVNILYFWSNPLPPVRPRRQLFCAVRSPFPLWEIIKLWSKENEESSVWLSCSLKLTEQGLLGLAFRCWITCFLLLCFGFRGFQISHVCSWLKSSDCHKTWCKRSLFRVPLVSASVLSFIFWRFWLLPNLMMFSSASLCFVLISKS